MKTIPMARRTGNVAKKVTSSKSVPSKSGRVGGTKKGAGLMMRSRGAKLMHQVASKVTSGAPTQRRITKLEKKYGPYNEA